MKKISTTAFFIIGWLLLSLLQAIATNLTSDEGYYWFLSNHLQWGYYDHPPLTMLMIKAGYSIFQNELGVRLLNIILSTASFLLLVALLPENERKEKFTYLVLVSQPLLHYFSIIVFPDVPLLFFGLVYLHGYKRSLEKNDFIAALVMGIAMTGMFYSKYYGVLFLLFTVLSNLRMLRAGWFWVSLSIPVLLSIPHFIWQYKNEFSSFIYHLQQRTAGAPFRHTAEFISQQILAIGPVFLVALLLFKSENQFEKTLKFIASGTLCFFLLISFRSFAHFHWTSVALFPLLFMAIKFYNNTSKQKLFFWLSIPFVLIIILFRIHIVYPFLPFKTNDLGYYKNRDAWAKEVSEIVGQGPVIFSENFREAGLYTFYTCKMATPLFSRSIRQTQYDLWGFEDSVQGKDVLLVKKKYFEGCQERRSAVGKSIYSQLIPAFESYFNIDLKLKMNSPVNDSLQMNVTIINKRISPLLFTRDPSGHQPVLFYRIKNKNNNVMKSGTLREFIELDKMPGRSSCTFYFSIPVSEINAGNYLLEAGFLYGNLPESVNSFGNELIIEHRSH